MLANPRLQLMGALAVTGGFGLAVLGRVAVETTRDPTSHNLWPIEIMIAGGIGLAAAAVGVGMARVLQRARQAAGKERP